MEIICAPQKVGTSTQNGKSLRKMRPRIIGMTEMDNGINDGLLTAMSAVLGRRYKLFARDKGQHSRETAQFVRIGKRSCNVVFYNTIQLSPNVGKSGMGNDRWANQVVIRRFGKDWCIFNVHLNAGIQAVDGSGNLLSNSQALLRQDAYVESVKALEALVLDAKKRYNDRVVLMGDFNMIPIAAGMTWMYSPAQLFRRLGMRWVNDRVVYVAWADGLSMYRHKTVPAHSPLNASDHAWLRCWFWRTGR